MQRYVTALKNKENAERFKAVIALEEFGEPATEYLIQALTDEDRWVRYLAADALANIGAAHSVNHIIGLLQDTDQDVRFSAAAALGKLKDPRAIPHLNEVLVRDNGYVKIAAEEALELIATRTEKVPGLPMAGAPTTATVI